jgi:hypothetical protein
MPTRPSSHRLLLALGAVGLVAMAMLVLRPNRPKVVAPVPAHAGGAAGEAVQGTTPRPPGPADAAPRGADARAAVGFRTAEKLEEHFRRHGAEFGAATAADYLRLAQELRDGPAGGAVLEVVRRDGVITRFDYRSGAFLAFDPDGVIRTCFKPNDGVAYFRRQARRGG